VGLIVNPGSMGVGPLAGSISVDRSSRASGARHMKEAKARAGTPGPGLPDRPFVLLVPGLLCAFAFGIAAGRLAGGPSRGRRIA